MAPTHRPLTDLCLIAVFKQLTANDQIKTSQMSPRIATLVRAANRRLKMLVITKRKSVDCVEGQIKAFSLTADYPSLCLLAKSSSSPLPDYPTLGTPLSKWNYLQLEQSQHAITAVERLKFLELLEHIFPAVTDLKFVDFAMEFLIEMLNKSRQTTQWTRQLTSLMVIQHGIITQFPHQLITAINGLSALVHLAIETYDCKDLSAFEELKVTAQLKAIALTIYYADLSPIYRTLERYAAAYADLKVYLLGDCHSEYQKLVQQAHLRNRVVCLQSQVCFTDGPNLEFLCDRFPSLISVRVKIEKASQASLMAVFTALSQLQQLVHLHATLAFIGAAVEKDLLPHRPLPQLPSLRALDLVLNILSHASIERLNLGQTLPRLQALHCAYFYCASCQVGSVMACRAIRGRNDLPSATINCFKATLGKLHPALPHSQIIFSTNADGIKSIYSLEQLLSSGQ